MMMSPAFATTLAYDPTGNPYQMAYPAGATIYPTAPFPVPAAADPRTFEMIPHRIFTTELDLRLFFEKFGHVREAKVIRSSEGTSKGYGFITFDTEDEAKTVMQISANQEAEKLEFKGRRLNLGPAIRRMIHGPRFAPEYAIATPTGQILTTSAFGGVTYALTQSPFVVMPPPNQMQPFVYSPVSTVAPAQYTLSNTDAGNNRVQQFVANNATAPMVLVPNNGNTISPHDSPRTNGMSGQPQAVNGSVHIPAAGQPPQQQQAYVSMQQIAQVTTQPLTPMTPSIATQRAALFPPPAAYYAPTAPANDMTHYSQMTAPTYFFAPGGYQAIDGSGQTAAMAIPAPNPIQLVPQPITPQTPQPCFYDESMIGGWQNPAEVRPTSTPRRSPMKSVVSLPNQLGQVNLQQYERKECQQGGNVAAATNKQFP
ncbi:DAZ protein 1 [Loa loa]|uniref:DAZ protein 1 n=1 Tax=Loa loa TaxID=7209 RepID=A0A1S0U9H0_LOALO|nr:DAZ protein 1 [Loa loa]EFO26975.1 DAZ protein 1 [Loa loa]